MKKNERKIIRMFAELSLKKRKRVIEVLYRIQTDNKNMYDVSKQSLKGRDDALAQLDSLCNDGGTRDYCELNPQVTKEQLDRKLSMDNEDLEQNEVEVEDGTRGDCNIEPRVSKEQLDRELDEYMCSDPKLLTFRGCTSYQHYLSEKNKRRK